MQDGAYNSLEVKVKLADLLVAIKRFQDAHIDSTFKMIQEFRQFIAKMPIDYVDELEAEVMKMLKESSRSKKDANEE